jgi:diadenosine tetraphosphate (Ap4A) HIT family hydrolase
VTSPIIEHIWCGWRNAYINDPLRKVAPDGDTRSVFSRILASDVSDEDAGIVHRGSTCFAILNNFPYTVGHTMVLPYREVPDLEDLAPAEVAELWAMVTDAVRALKAAYSPQGVNVGINLGKAAGGSIAQHLHVHVVPRWLGDANFMAATASTRSIPESLDDTWRKVTTNWPSGSVGSVGGA